MNDLSVNELKDFFLHLDEYEKEMLIAVKQDEFLDLYMRWLNSKGTGVKEKVNVLAKELMEIDSSFKFNLLD